MNIRQLRYFLALSEDLHFKRASERLFIVQPALSKQIAALEKEMGVHLFIRNKRNVQLSEAGAYLKQHGRTLLEQFEKIKNETVLVALGEKGEIRIGYVGSCIHTFLPKMLADLHKTFPQIQTYLSEMNSATQIEAIQKGLLDIAFLRNPPQTLPWQNKLVFRESFSLVLPVGHPLHAENFVGVSQLAHEWFILPTKKDGLLYHQLQWSICEDAGFTPKIAHETVHGYTTLNLVENGLGVSFLPTSFKNVSHAAVKFIELQTLPQKAEITAIWDAENPNPALRKFLHFVNPGSYLPSEKS